MRHLARRGTMFGNFNELNAVGAFAFCHMLNSYRAKNNIHRAPLFLSILYARFAGDGVVDSPNSLTPSICIGQSRKFHIYTITSTYPGSNFRRVSKNIGRIYHDAELGDKITSPRWGRRLRTRKTPANAHIVDPHSLPQRLYLWREDYKMDTYDRERVVHYDTSGIIPPNRAKYPHLSTVDGSRPAGG